MKNYCIMTIGLSHSGKSTLAQTINKHFNNRFVVIENDTFHQFCLDNFPQLYHHTKPNKNPNNPNLKNLYLQTMIPYCIANGFEVILANCRNNKSYRKRYIDMLHKLGQEVILVYCNTSLETIKQRIQHQSNHKNEELYLNGFEGQLAKQLEIFEIPTPDEADHFIEYDGLDMEKVIDSISPLIKKSTPE